MANFFPEQWTSAPPQGDIPGAPLPLPQNHPTIDFPLILELTVLRTLQYLPVNKSTADPLLTNLVLRECAPVITPSVSYLFNLSVSTGVFPAMWKQVTVVPLFKNRGKAEDPTNYRPISLLPALGKALEKIQTTHLLQYLVERKIKLVSPHQFGLMPQKSTTLQLLYLTDRWFRALERGKNISAVFLDFRKAFDRVWHHGLLYQLSTLGVSEWSVKWLTTLVTLQSAHVALGRHKHKFS